MASSADNQASAVERTTISIVLVTECSRDDDRLCQLLARQQWQAVMVTEPIAAMVEAALREREQTARSEWGLLRNEYAVVVLSQHWLDQQTDGGEALVRAMCQYLPSVELWAQAGDELVLLRRTTPAISSAASAPHRRESASRSNDMRSMINSEASASQLDTTITREEMDMLLETFVESET
jgi:hypothetical protein